MIEGVVNSAYEAAITLTLRSPTGQTREIDAVIDTGYTGFLTLPPELVAELEFPFASTAWATLADGSEVDFDVYYAIVLWDGEARTIEADEAGATPLIGMALLAAHSLYLEVAHGGPVAINALA